MLQALGYSSSSSGSHDLAGKLLLSQPEQGSKMRVGHAA